MSDVIITGIFTLLGVFTGFYSSMLLRKEKFAELIYKEKLVVYKKISESVLFISTSALISSVQENTEERKKTVETLSDEVSKLMIEVLLNRFIISGDVFKACLKIVGTYDKKLTDEEKKNMTVVVHANELINSMRKELGVDVLSQDIINAIEFNFKTLLKQRTRDVLKNLQGHSDIQIR